MWAFARLAMSVEVGGAARVSMSTLPEALRFARPLVDARPPALFERLGFEAPYPRKLVSIGGCT